MMSLENKDENKKHAREELWRRGLLSFKLDSTQKELYSLFYNSKHKIMTWLLSRRQGKTYTLCILALEQCIRKQNSIVKFVSPTKIQVNNNVRPIIRQILEDCPNDIKPEFRAKDYIYYFPNGSEIQLAGTDGGHAEKLRGGDSDIFFVDEAGSCSDLDNVIKNILLPTTLITKGKGVLASTPPSESEHDFLNYIEEADRRGSLIKKTVYDNPRITKDQLDELINELGGLSSDSARRELLCEIIKDSTTSVIPEFTETLAPQIIKEWPRPPFFDVYVSMDIGFKDLTVVLFGYFDFRADKIVIEDELVVDFQDTDMNIKTLTELILKKEETLFINPLTLEVKPPYKRVSDINYIVTQEIYQHSNHKLSFDTADKYDNSSAINTVRLMIGNQKVIINPRCTTLVRHLKNAKWMKNKEKFARSPDNGHYDAVDALKYLIRSVALKKNPYPAHYNLNMTDLFINNPEKFNTPNNQIEVYKKIFGIKPKRRY
jgi:hypothetical protein